MKTEERRSLLRTVARTAVATAIGALTAKLSLRRGTSNEGYCDHGGRCGGCPVTNDCEVFVDMGGSAGRSRP
jgi:hypothetical protein